MFIKWWTIIKHSQSKTHKGNALTKFSGQRACMVYNESTRGIQVCAVAAMKQDPRGVQDAESLEDAGHILRWQELSQMGSS